jgi:pSer/pThr/pTyr-binding forkhead associated (FHA) protein
MALTLRGLGFEVRGRKSITQGDGERHSPLRNQDSRWRRRVVLLCGSLYGTYVNDERVEGDAAMLVKSGDKIRLGDIELEVLYEI